MPMYQIETRDGRRVWKTLPAESREDADMKFKALVDRKYPELKPLISKYGAVAIEQGDGCWDIVSSQLTA
jgi:hypothetical protein